MLVFNVFNSEKDDKQNPPKINRKNMYVGYAHRNIHAKKASGQNPPVAMCYRSSVALLREGVGQNVGVASV